jgi:cold shock protein
MKGTVKWFNRKNGYGFIQGADNKDYFVHYSAVEKGTFLRDNDEVEFEPAETDKGLQSKDVKLLRKASDIESGNAPAENAEEDTEEDTEENTEEDTEEEKEQ